MYLNFRQKSCLGFKLDGVVLNFGVQDGGVTATVVRTVAISFLDDVPINLG